MDEEFDRFLERMRAAIGSDDFHPTSAAAMGVVLGSVVSAVEATSRALDWTKDTPMGNTPLVERLDAARTLLLSIQAVLAMTLDAMSRIESERRAGRKANE